MMPTYHGAMSDRPQWLIREDASVPVLVALALRQSLGIRAPEELPALRDLPARGPEDSDAVAALEEQWIAYWDMTVEPRAHHAGVPLELVDGFKTVVALPATGADELRDAISPLGETALAYARSAHANYSTSMQPGKGANAYRAYASAIAEFERSIGRRAHSFELNVQVLPFTQRGIWWIGDLSVAVTDSLRRDVVAFDAAIRPIITELA